MVIRIPAWLALALILFPIFFLILGIKLLKKSTDRWGDIEDPGLLLMGQGFVLLQALLVLVTIFGSVFWDSKIQTVSDRAVVQGGEKVEVVVRTASYLQCFPWNYDETHTYVRWSSAAVPGEKSQIVWIDLATETEVKGNLLEHWFQQYLKAEESKDKQLERQRTIQRILEKPEKGLTSH